MDETRSSEHAAEDDAPLYKFSWRRFAVVMTALLTLPVWAPWVREHVSRQAMILLLPFVIIFVASLFYVTSAFSTKSIRQKHNRRK